MPLPPKSSMGWQDRADCRGIDDPGRFDRLGRLPSRFEIERTKSALKICAGCPVSEECLAFGMRGRSSGVYGGVYLVAGSRALLPKAPPKPMLRRTAA